MERCARSCFARDLRRALPEGWRNDEGDRRGHEFQLAGVFLTLMMALPESYHGAIDRVERAMNTIELPAGWLPEGPDDPALIEVFASCWQAPSE